MSQYDSQISDSQANDWQVADCPACGNPMRLYVVDLGSEITCPVCSHVLIVAGDDSPDPGGSPASGQAPVQEAEPVSDAPRAARARTRHRARRASASGETESGEIPASVQGEAGEDSSAFLLEQGSREASSFSGFASKPLDEGFKSNLKGTEEWQQEAESFVLDYDPYRLPVNQELMAWDVIEKEERGAPLNVRFMGASFFLLLSAFVVFLVVAATSDSRIGEDVPVVEKEEPAPPTISSVLRAQVETSPSWVVEQLSPVIADFCQATNWKERLAYIREPERVRPLMESYYKIHPDGPSPFRRILLDAGVTYRDSIFLVKMEMLDYRSKSIVVDVSGGRFLVDWEAFVGYCEMDPDQFRESRPTEPVLMRGMVSRPKGPYFNYLFKDEENLDCFLMVFSNNTYVFAYALKSSPEGRRLRRELENVNQMAATLKLAFPENASSSNQVWIREILGEGWILKEEGEAALSRSS